MQKIPLSGRSSKTIGQGGVHWRGWRILRTLVAGVCQGYVVNNANPEFSEYGDIYLKYLNGLKQYGCPAVERDISIRVGMTLKEALEKSADPKPSWWD